MSDESANEMIAIETREWLESLDWVLDQGGPQRVRRPLEDLQIHATKAGVEIPFQTSVELFDAREPSPLVGDPDVLGAIDLEAPLAVARVGRIHASAALVDPVEAVLLASLPRVAAIALGDLENPRAPRLDRTWSAMVRSITAPGAACSRRSWPIPAGRRVRS